MRVVHICQRDDPDIGGSLRVAEALVYEQRELGVDAWLLFLYGPPSFVTESLLSHHVVCLGLASSRGAVRGIVLLRKAIRKINPDLIHTHDGILWPRLVYLQLEIPLVMHAHLPANRSLSWLAGRLIMKTTDLLVGISLPTIDTWINAGYPQEQIKYISNGVSLRRFHKVDRKTKLALREKLGLPPRKKILLWVVRLHKSMKGSVRIERIGRLLPEDMVLVVVGNGPEYEAMLENNDDLIQAGKMVMTGGTDEPQEYYMASDAFLFTSHYEPFGLVILEAAASELPILAFPVDQGGGATELLREMGACAIDDDLSRGKVDHALREVMSKIDATNGSLELVRIKYLWAGKARELMVAYRLVLDMPLEAGLGKPKVLVCQHGARRRYAMPRMLNHAGMLSALYTDSSAESFIGKLVKLLGKNAPEAWKNFSRWDIQGIPRSKIYSSDRSFFIELTQKLLRSQKDGIQLYHQRHRVLSSRMKKWGLQDSNVVYSMYHENLDFVRWAKDRGALSVVDVFISPMTDQIMEKEASFFPGWADTFDLYTLELERKLWEEVASLADLLICPSEWVAEGVRMVSPSAANKIRIVPYGCSIDYQGHVNRPVKGRVLFAGRDPLRKGLHYLAQAASQLRGSIPELDVRVAGNLSESIVEHPMCKDLNFLGQLDGKQMKKEYLSADVLVLPALSEGFAGVVAEAIGAGCPVIVTREAGSPIVHEREGLIVPSRDVDALVSVIQRMVTDRPFREQCASECLRQVPFYAEEAWWCRLEPTILECKEQAHA